jgi:hypothetical protein
MSKGKAKNTAFGAGVTRHKAVRATLDDVEYVQVERLRKHYGFETDSDLLRALIKRACLSLPV